MHEGSGARKGTRLRASCSERTVWQLFAPTQHQLPFHLLFRRVSTPSGQWQAPRQAEVDRRTAHCPPRLHATGDNRTNVSGVYYDRTKHADGFWTLSVPQRGFPLRPAFGTRLEPPIKGANHAASPSYGMF